MKSAKRLALRQPVIGRNLGRQRDRELRKESVLRQSEESVLLYDAEGSVRGHRSLCWITPWELFMTLKREVFMK